ncbi:MAG: TetR/AcrR family transcriptional regulator [Actinomycetota bacterium]|jgi:AcrR family transcriptional regulator|nr:TetR/AcrR family transcriptional regulator [Actinomycetota bacterium]
MVISPTRPAKRLTARQRRQQLLDVALRLFANNGFTTTTMDDIAEAAGVTKPLLYQHFDSKRALYVELVDSVTQRLLRAIGEATAAADGPRQQVEAGFEVYFAMMLAHADAFRLLFASDTTNDPEMAAMVRHVEDMLAEAIDPLIHADLDDNHRRLLAHAVVGMAEGASRYVLTRPEQTLDGTTATRLARRIGDLAWAGLRSVHRD